MVLDIYTDARSGQSRVIHISSLIIDQDENEYHFSEKTSIGLVKNTWTEFRGIKFKANSTVAELFSIYRILNKVSKLNKNINKIRIYTDSHTSFEMLNGLGSPKSELSKKIIESMRGNIDKFNVDIMWIKSHCGVYGNEIADSLCKSHSKDINQLELIK